MSLAPTYTGFTCIGNLIKGEKDGEKKEIFIYNVCDHAECYKEVESQAISYTAGVPPVAAAILVAKGIWNPKTMVNVEELDPDPFLKLLDKIGLPTKVEDKTPVAETVK
jgi:saccharopine dehydrogenase-like NADP-dependent oxidoreductase